MNWPRNLAGALALAITAGAVASAATAQSPAAPTLRHPRIAQAAELSGARAEAVYRAIRLQMRTNYATSSDPVALAYQTWKRFNKTPYRSRNHGERFVNHYANATASGYGRFENLDPLPEGAIIIKDSFTVTRNGAVMTGPLFMMEKMAAGFASAAGTWRFMMLRADGSLVGMTGGPNSNKMGFCADCHKDAGAKHDFLYFMPKAERIPATR